MSLVASSCTARPFGETIDMTFVHCAVTAATPSFDSGDGSGFWSNEKHTTRCASTGQNAAVASSEGASGTKLSGDAESTTYAAPCWKLHAASSENPSDRTEGS